MKWRKLLILGLILGPWTFCAWAQETASIAVIFSSENEAYRQAYAGAQQAFADSQLSPTVVTYNLQRDGQEATAAQLAKQSPKLILALGTQALTFARQTSKQTPIIFCMVLNPDTSGTAPVAGVSMNIPASVKLKQVKRVLPKTSVLSLVYSPDSLPAFNEVTAAAQGEGFKLISKQIGSEKDLPDAVRDVAWRSDAFLMIPDSKIFFAKSVEYLLEESLKHPFPVIGLSSVYTKAGALFSVQCDYKDLGLQAGELAVRILKGAKARELGLVAPRKAVLSVNVATAEQMSIHVPPDVLKEAQETFGQ